MSLPKLFISGHRGLLGSACVRQLKHKYEILTMERSLFDETWVRYWFAENEPDYVIHCAAKVGGVKANKENPCGFLIDNLAIQNAVLTAAADYGVKRLINIGTSCMYPKDAKTPIKETDFTGGSLEPSVSAYATAKIAGYALCKAYNEQFGKSFITVCPANLYGSNDNYGPSAHVIPSLIRRFAEAKQKGLKEVDVWGDGTAVREFLCADDCARAIGKVLDAESPPDLINIGSGESTSIRRLVWLIQEALHTKIEVKWDTTQPTGIQEKTFDISRIKSLGWEPMIPLDAGLTSTIFDYLNSPNTRLR